MRQLRTVLPYFRPYRKAMLWGLVLVILANGFALANPYLLKLPIDALTADAEADPDATRRTVLHYALLIVGIALLGNAARYGMREILNSLSRRIEVDLRNDFLRHLLRLDAGFYGRTRTGDLMSLATNDTLAVRQAVGPAVMYSANTVVSFVFGLGVMIWISPSLTLAALVPMTLLPPVVLWFGRTIHTRFERIQEQFAALSTMVQENLTGVRIVRAYAQEAAQAREFDGFNREYLKRNMHLAYVSGAFHPIMGAADRRGHGGRALVRGPPGHDGHDHDGRLRGLLLLPGAARVADDRAGVGGQPLPARRGVDGAHQPDLRDRAGRCVTRGPASTAPGRSGHRVPQRVFPLPGAGGGGGREGV